MNDTQELKVKQVKYTREQRAKLNPDNIPDYLKSKKIWLVWSARAKPNGKFDKIPHWAIPGLPNRSGEQGNGLDRSRLVTMPEALAIWKSHKGLAGIGIAFLPDEGIIAIDVDSCFDPSLPGWFGEGFELAERLSGLTYSEVSPSGKGARILLLGSSHSAKNTPAGMELFGNSGFVTITGDSFGPVKDIVEITGEDLAAVVRACAGEGKSGAVVDRGSIDDEYRELSFIAATPEPTTLEELRQAIEFLPANYSDDRGSWVGVLMGLASLKQWGVCEEGRELAHLFSAKSDKYDPAEVDRKWDSPSDLVSREKTYKSIFKLAYDSGWGGPEVKNSDPIIELCDKIDKKIASSLGCADVKADRNIIKAMVEGSFWSSAKSKLVILDVEGCYLEYTKDDALKFLVKLFGKAVRREEVAKVCDEKDLLEGLTKAEAKRFIPEIVSIPTQAVFDYVRMKRQRNVIQWTVDMWVKKSKVVLHEEVAELVIPHRDFHCGYSRNAEIESDFKEHFPRFDVFLDFIAMSRFAADRKKAYLWINAPSDWGKGFLVDTVLGGDELKLVTKTSTDQVEAIMEGKPVGLAISDFKRSMILAIDEFKSIKSEIKQLQSSMTVSPKNQLNIQVPLFAKVFTSAEDVASLTTDDGVEDQFANRMSYFEEVGDIEKRSAWVTHGSVRYRQALIAYTCEYLNTKFEELRAMGKLDSGIYAHRWLTDFNKEYGIGNEFGKTSEALPGIAEDFLKLVHGADAFTPGIDIESNKVETISGEVGLKKSKNLLKSFLTMRNGGQPDYCLNRKIPDIIKLIVPRGARNKPKTVRVKVPGKEDESKIVDKVLIIRLI